VRDPSPTVADRLDQAEKGEQDDGPERGDPEAGEVELEGDVPPGDPGVEQPAERGTDDADQHADQAPLPLPAPPADDDVGDPPDDGPEHDPRDDSHAADSIAGSGSTVAVR